MELPRCFSTAAWAGCLIRVVQTSNGGLYLIDLLLQPIPPVPVHIYLRGPGLAGRDW